MSDFHGQNVIVTGAGQGIGYGLCAAFAHAGANVILNDVDAELANAAATQLNAAIGAERVVPCAADVAEQSQTIVDCCTAHFGPPHITIANAGITYYVDFLDSTPDIFDRIVDVNLRGTYFLAQAAAKRLIAAQTGGRLLLMSSVTGLRAFHNFSIYSMTKAAIRMLAQSLALELGQHNITVNAIAPGAILTERTVRDDPNYAANWATVTPNGRVGQVDDIVETARFLASSAASHITGQTLVVDGGWTLPSTVPAAHPDMPDEQNL